MARRRKPKSGADAFLDILPQAVGLILVAVLFVPGVKQLLGTLFLAVLAAVAMGALAAVGWAIYKKMKPARSPESLDAAHFVAPAASLPVTRTGTPPAAVTALKPQWTRELLSKLEWKRFEEVVAAYTREIGYRAKTTRIGADGGVDIEVFETGGATPIMVIQCKAWDAYKVGVKPLRELYGVMAANKIGNGAFFTTGEFTTEALAFADGKHLDLVDGQEFVSRLHSLTVEQQDRLVALATAGDYTTPSCPSCDVKMVLRTAKSGPNAGSEFWGCPRYPHCRQTFRVSHV